MALTIFSQYIRFMSLIRAHSRLPKRLIFFGSDLVFCLCGNCRQTVIIIFFFLSHAADNLKKALLSEQFVLHIEL